MQITVYLWLCIIYSFTEKDIRTFTYIHTENVKDKKKE